MLANKFYYFIKPFIPRSLQIVLRKRIILKRRHKFAHIWPIDPGSGRKPADWPGWPEAKRFALVLTHDVEAALGVRQCLALAEMEKSLGFKSAFNFVAEAYPVDSGLYSYLRKNGFEIGVHGLNHKGNLFHSEENFLRQVPKINHYLKKWEASGFRAPSMYHNLDWIGHLDIEYDMSTFDTDPFEPQPDGTGTIFPFWYEQNGCKGYVELPYTLPQDHTLFILMEESGIEVWARKLQWIRDAGGMALLITHPDYMNFSNGEKNKHGYPAAYYRDFLEHIRQEYEGEFWNPLPKDLAGFCKNSMIEKG